MFLSLPPMPSSYFSVNCVDTVAANLWRPHGLISSFDEGIGNGKDEPATLQLPLLARLPGSTPSPFAILHF